MKTIQWFLLLTRCHFQPLGHSWLEMTPRERQKPFRFLHTSDGKQIPIFATYSSVHPRPFIFRCAMAKKITLRIGAILNFEDIAPTWSAAHGRSEGHKNIWREENRQQSTFSERERSQRLLYTYAQEQHIFMCVRMSKNRPPPSTSSMLMYELKLLLAWCISRTFPTKEFLIWQFIFHHHCGVALP